MEQGKTPRRARSFVRSRWLVGPAVLGLAASGVLATTLTASAATLFSADFENGSLSGWSRSGGSWAIGTDGSRVLEQSSTSGDARLFAGSTSWANYTVQARVKATSGGSGAALLGRATGSTAFDRLVLLANGQAQLQTVNGSSVTVLGTGTGVPTGSWATLQLVESGSTVTGFVNGTRIGSGTSRATRGRIGLQTLATSARFDDVLVTDSTSGGGTTTTTTTTRSDGGTTTTTTGTSTTTTSTSGCTVTGSNVADGWAGVNAWNSNGTTGGAGGQTVTVTNEAQFNQYATAAAPYIIQVSGLITLSKMTDVGSNKTIVGVGSGSGFTGYGLNIGLPISDSITSPPANAVHNVILRNLRITGSADDNINVQMFSHHIWIDHNDLSAPNDGALDIKRGSSYVTVSWNHVHDADKNMLLGRDDADSAQDTGRLLVSYHHNWFDATSQRNPRVRYGNPVHVYNNYYNDIDNYGIASTIGAGVLVEGNYFENVEDPYHLREGDTSVDGTLVARDNFFVNSGTGVTAGSVNPIGYAYTLDPASSVKSIVTSGSGTGKVGIPSGGGATTTTCPGDGTTTTTTTTRPVTTTTTTTRPVTTTTTTTTDQTPGGPVGWASQNGGTTGGAGGPTVTVTSFADFRTQATSSGARTILVSGVLSGSGTVEITANKTIRGVGASSGISGAVLNIEDQSPANVIIQNLNLHGVPGNDTIQIENATNIWIDHNTLSSTIEDDPDVYDGLIDITHAGDYITVSWNILKDHWKTSLVGHSDSNAGEDTGKLKVTYHHNWFDRTFERSPRIRFGDPVHVYNNLYTNIINDSATYAIASTENAGVLVEGNVFENVNQACWSASGYADSGPGRLVARNNLFSNSGPCETNGTVASIPYSYQLDDVNTVRSLVTGRAGAGRL